MTLNGEITLILRYLTKFSSFGGRLRQSNKNVALRTRCNKWYVTLRYAALHVTDVIIC